MTTAEGVKVPFIGGPLGEHGEDDMRGHRVRTAANLVEGTVVDHLPASVDGDEPDVIERYVMTHDGERWIYRYDGRHVRPVRERNRVLLVVGGPFDGTITKIRAFASALTLQAPNTTAGHHTAHWYRETFFPGHGDEYELRHDDLVGQYWQYTG